ncbi:heme ABC transporter ATP-binding protein [Rhodoferax saidenbachensis]|uniref:Heme ABC transporter ATP-binding protein n=1 Tax=Rhodoferax saidenbachensis TaxID=1484693 RepID=A0A1P8K996_9BURK|nr:heme ABC transporter ATP-binding protein [Rhodoferax saidenbachensis]APW42578.1 heme ABC transporter ATP-binding protein [Rhodoferax saidenbachensis]
MSQLQVQAASFAVQGLHLLQPVSLDLQPGQLTALLGPNGAGKSTLLSLISGQRRPSGGHVVLNGQALSGYRPEALAQVRALLPQDSSIAFDYTVREVVELGRFPHRLKPNQDEAGIVDAAMRATDMHALQDRVVNTLSGGERARAQLARVLAQIWDPLPGGAPRWLLMDEPTAALDLSHQHQVLRLARDWAVQQGVGVVAVLHDLNLALRYADQVVLLQKGQVFAQGAPHEVLQPETVQTVWKVQAQAIQSDDGVAQLLVH